jgi:hypothetical protein
MSLEAAVQCVVCNSCLHPHCHCRNSSSSGWHHGGIHFNIMTFDCNFFNRVLVSICLCNKTYVEQRKSWILLEFLC